MPRVAGIDIPNEKRIDIALTYIYGIGDKVAKDILKQAKRENKNVIVFCDKGISRSATFVIAALMYFECFLTYNAAFAYVRSKRPIIEPNLGFVLRLTWLFQSDDEHLPHFLEEIGCADLAAPSAQQMPCCAEKNPFDLTC